MCVRVLFPHEAFDFTTRDFQLSDHVFLSKNVSHGATNWVVKRRWYTIVSCCHPVQKLCSLKLQESLSIRMTDLLFICPTDGRVIQKGSSPLIRTQAVGAMSRANSGSTFPMIQSYQMIPANY